MIREASSKSPFLPRWVWVMPFGAAALLWETLQGTASNASTRVVWYSVLIITGAAGLTWVCRAQKEFDLFEPLYMVFGLFVIFYPLRSLFAVWLDESWFEPSKAAIWKALSASALGFASFALGYKLVQKMLNSCRETWLDRAWNLGRVSRISVFLLLIGMSGFAAVLLLGGSAFYFISLDSEIKSPESVKAWFFYVQWLCVFAQVGALLQLGNWLSTGRRTLWTVTYCVLALLSTFFLSRYFTVLFLLMLVLSWHYQRSRVKTVHLAVLSVFVLSYLGLAGLYREWISPQFTLEETAGFGDLASHQSELVLRYVVRNFEQLSNLNEVISMVPSELPYQFGATFTPVFLKPIPRAVMPTKPLGASAVFSRQLIPDLYDNGFVTGIGGWGEWYLNFSWPGLAFGMAVMGGLTGTAYKLMRARKDFGRLLLYLSSVVALFTWLRNDFNSATTFGLYYFIPAILALLYVTKTDKATFAAPSKRFIEGVA